MMDFPSITTTFAAGNQGVQVGHNSGHIEAHVHVPPVERAETPTSTRLFIPFRRDPDFVDHGTLLDQIHERCSAPASRIALVGIGGVGKSQLAIEHCYRTSDQSPETWVFWVHASNSARLEQGYREIADQVKLRGRNDSQADVFMLVHNWLREEKNGTWLLVFDNADDVAVLSPPSSNSLADSGGNSALQRHLSRYIPPNRHGSVLITSRTQRAASQLVEETDILTIEPMPGPSAHALLYKKLNDAVDVNEEVIAELAAALEYLPLALVQAAAYIRKRAPRCSVRQYLKTFRENDRKKTSLLNHEAGHLRRDEDASNSIIIAWQISFDYIRDVRKSAADLLSLMSFFDRQGIPASLLRDQSISDHTPGAFNTDSRGDEEISDVGSISDKSIHDGFEEDVLMLRDYSFVSMTTHADSFEMHRLVQLATRNWLRSRGLLNKWRQQFIANLSAEFPTGKYENWGQCQILFPHARSALAQRPQTEDSLKRWAQILYCAAWYAWEQGRAGEAEEMSMRSAEVRAELLGDEDNETLSSKSMLGLALKNQGRWKEAEPLQVLVMETRKKMLGEKHPDTLLSMTNLALTYMHLGRWKEAEQIQVLVTDASKEVLGKRHSDTLTSMTNLACTYRFQGRWKEAEQLQLILVEIEKNDLGERHPSTLVAMGHLAMTYMRQGRWNEAEQIQVLVMDGSKKELGEKHPDTLISIGNLGLTYWFQGRWKEAEQLQLLVVEIGKKDLGDKHPDMLACMGNLAMTYRSQGRWNEAEQIQVLVVDRSKKVLGERHPDTLTRMEKLAMTYTSQGRWKEAEQLQVLVMEIINKDLGERHPDALLVMGNLALTYWNQGRWKEAEQLEVFVMETRKIELGERHPDTLISMENLAYTWRSLGAGCEHKALLLMKECCVLKQQVLGSEHPDAVSSLRTLEIWKKEDEVE